MRPVFTLDDLNVSDVKCVQTTLTSVSVPYHSVNVEDRIMEIRQISARQNF